MTPRQSRGQVLWDEAKRTAAKDIRDMIESVAVDLRESLRDKVQALTAALAGKADVAHMHQPADVTGLVATFNALQTRLTAAEARITALEAKVP